MERNTTNNNNLNHKIQQVKLDTKKLKVMVRRHKGLFMAKKTVVKHRSPVLWLIRQSGDVEYYDNIRGNTYKYKHSDDKQRTIVLEQGRLLNFPYGKSMFKGYIHHEDAGLPYPHDPVNDAKLLDIQQDKLLNDIRKYHAQELKAKGEMWWKIAIGIAVILGVYVLYTLVQSPDQVIQQVTSPGSTPINATSLLP